MDRKLVGILSIITIITTVLSIELFGYGVDEPLQVVTNNYPSNIPRSGYGRPRFVLDLVATGPLPDVVVEYSILKKTHPALEEPWNQTNASEWEALDLAGNILLLREALSWFDRCARDGLGLPIVIKEDALVYNGSLVEMYIFDFTDAFRALGLGLGQLNTTDTVWAVMVSARGEVFTYSGVRDFFFDRLGIMYSFEVSDGGGIESFASPKMPPELRMGKPGIGQAPALGTIHRKDVSEDDRIHILFELMAERIFPNEGFIQLVTIRAGSNEIRLVNVISTSEVA